MKSMRTCICIIGMHRSGTSALAGLLHELGIDFGRNLLPPAPDNPKGFFENQRMLGINFNLLYELGQFYFSTAPLTHMWPETSAAKRFAPLIREFLSHEFGKQEVFALKDPRLSLLLPAWDGAFADLGIRTAVVLTLRSPLETAVSLSTRDRLPLETSIRLWIKYTLSAAEILRERRGLILAYEDTLGSWRNSMQTLEKTFNISLMPRDPEALQRADAFLSPELRHHRKPALPPDADEGCRVCLELADSLHLILSRSASQPYELTAEHLAKVARAYDLMLRARPLPVGR